MKDKELALRTAEDIKEMNLTIRTMQNSVKTMIEQLKEICPHEVEMHNTDFIPGSYYDTCTYIDIYTCDLCGKVRRVETSGGYG